MRPSIALASLWAVLALSACSSFPNPDPVFESERLSDVVRFGGECAEQRCVTVIAMVRGSREGVGSCALYGPGDPEKMQPLAENHSIKMIPDEESEWIVELIEDSPETAELNAVCEPMMEG